MRFLIVTHAVHKKVGDQWFAYGPYVKEMNLWTKYVDEVTIIAPVTDALPDPIDLPYDYSPIRFVKVDAIRFNSTRKAIASVFKLPAIFFQIIKQMKWAQHIHLRCPGNLGLIGCVAQLFFPHKVKTAKFAGNWDLKSKKRITYRMQQVLIRNTAVTKNMTGLVYGIWPDRTKNIKPFFTASYTTAQNKHLTIRSLGDPLKLIFVGVLGEGKEPLLSVKVCCELNRQGVNTELHIYGEGSDRQLLLRFIQENQLEGKIFLHGNQPQKVVQEALQESHFLVFKGSKSEGWPKVVAEAMWWGCLPITSSVSCVPEMIGNGERGEIVDNYVEDACRVIISYKKQPELYKEKCLKAATWARNYTLELFESEIKKLLHGPNPSNN